MATKKPGKQGETRKYNRMLDQAIRDRVDPELIVDFHLLVMQGHDAELVADSRTTSGLRAAYPSGGEVKPDLATRIKSATFLANHAWGMPVQNHAVEAKIRAESIALHAGVDVDALMALPPAAKAEMLGVLARWRLTAATGELPSLPDGNEDVKDAEILSEQPGHDAPADGDVVPDDGDGGGGADVGDDDGGPAPSAASLLGLDDTDTE